MQNDRRKRRAPTPWYRQLCSTFPLILLFTALLYAYATALLYIHSHKEAFTSSFPTVSFSNDLIPVWVVNQSTTSVALPNISAESPNLHNASIGGIMNEQQHVFDIVKATLKGHPLHKLNQSQRSTFQFEDYFAHVQKQDQCKALPVFTSMANVFSELYWQL